MTSKTPPEVSFESRFHVFFFLARQTALCASIRKDSPHKSWHFFPLGSYPDSPATYLSPRDFVIELAGSIEGLTGPDPSFPPPTKVHHPENLAADLNVYRRFFRKYAPEESGTWSFGW